MNATNKNVIIGVFCASKESVNILNMLKWSESEQAEYAKFMVTVKEYIKLKRSTEEAARNKDLLISRFSTSTFTSVDNTISEISKLKDEYDSKTKFIDNINKTLDDLEPVALELAIQINGRLIDPYEPETKDETMVLNQNTAECTPDEEF